MSAEEKVDFVTEYKADGSVFRKRLDRLTDGRVMCCICFEFTPRENLNPVKGDPDGAVEDVCKGCAVTEEEIRVWRASFAHRKTFKVLTTGSQTWTDEEVIRDALGRLLSAAQHAGRRMIVRHGGCKRGADRIVRQWCIDHGALEDDPALRKVLMDEWKADWEVGLHGGMIRNQDMVNGGADSCLAFNDNSSSGTTHCAGAARKAGIVTVEWKMTGSVLTAPPRGWTVRVPV